MPDKTEPKQTTPEIPANGPSTQHGTPQVALIDTLIRGLQAMKANKAQRGTDAAPRPGTICPLLYAEW
jgi:hypothetical protein